MLHVWRDPYVGDQNITKIWNGLFRPISNNYNILATS